MAAKWAQRSDLNSKGWVGKPKECNEPAEGNVVAKKKERKEKEG
jgi:hypothetical protein